MLTVIYLIFNEGYAATRGQPLVRAHLCAEAIRLGRLVRGLMSPAPPEATALLALMLLHDSRRDARLDAAGDLVTLEEQDRELVGSARRSTKRCRSWTRRSRGGPGPYALQAAIAALHCQAPRAEDTDWLQIVRLYDLLERAAAVAGRLAESRGRGRDGRRSAQPASRSSTRSPRAETSTITTCSTPRAPICCAGLDESPTRPRATRARSHWPPTTANGAFWSAGSRDLEVG